VKEVSLNFSQKLDFIRFGTESASLFWHNVWQNPTTKSVVQVFTGAIMGDGDKGVGSIDEIPACVIGDPIGGSGGGGIMVPPALPYMLEPGFKETPAISFVLLPREKSSKITSTYFVLCPTVNLRAKQEALHYKPNPLVQHAWPTSLSQ
jgi:hypothetical protein